MLQLAVKGDKAALLTRLSQCGGQGRSGPLANGGTLIAGMDARRVQVGMEVCCYTAICLLGDVRRFGGWHVAVLIGYAWSLGSNSAGVERDNLRIGMCISP
jgi:hypothetical protein